jgi:hypothetical protein
MALVVTGYWAYTKFLSSEKPGLEMRVEVSMDLKEEEPGPTAQSCYVYLNFFLKNTGTISFDVAGLRVQAWKAKPPEISSSAPTFIDPSLLEGGSKIIDMEQAALLNMHFSPGESAGRTFTWVFPEPSTDMYLFKINLDAVNAGVRKHISTSTWSQHVCRRR